MKVYSKVYNPDNIETHGLRSALGKAITDNVNPIQLRDMVVGYLGVDPETVIEEMRLVGEDMAKLSKILDAIPTRRDAVLAVASIVVRNDLHSKGMPSPTDGRVRELAQSSKQYLEWLDENDKMRIEYERLKNEYWALSKTIDYWITVISFGKSELQRQG